MSEDTQMSPYTQEGEEALIGSILINEMAWDRVSHVKPEDFFILRNRMIWEAMHAVHGETKQLSFVAIVAHLKDVKKLEMVGGATYLAYLINHAATWIHAETYAHLVLVNAARRRLIELSTQMKQLAYNAELPLQDIKKVVDESTDEWLKFASLGQDDKSRPMLMTDIISEEIDRLDERIMNPNKFRVVPSSLATIRSHIHGYAPGKTYCFGARTGHGKSVMLLTEAIHAVKSGFKALYVNLEMSNAEQAQRLNMQVTGVSTAAHNFPNMTTTVYERIIKGYGDLSTDVVLDNFSSVDVPMASLSQIREFIKHAKFEMEGLDVVYIDHAQLIEHREENLAVGMKKIFDTLHAFAKEFNVAILIATQYVKMENSVSRMPNNNDLYGGAATTQALDAMFHMIYYNACDDTEELEEPKGEQVDIHCGKLRFGEAFWTASVRFETGQIRMIDMPQVTPPKSKWEF